MQAQTYLSAGDVAAKWRQSTPTEKPGSPEHAFDLRRMLTQPTADATGESYAFEQRGSTTGEGKQKLRSVGATAASNTRPGVSRTAAG